jgi:hypothetical protein
MNRERELPSAGGVTAVDVEDIGVGKLLRD